MTKTPNKSIFTLMNATRSCKAAAVNGVKALWGFAGEY
jgi:hypothetical protein